MAKFLLPDEEDALDAAIAPQQREAAASPDRPTRELIGNFGDFDSLFEQLTKPPVFELGNPLPKPGYLPKKRAGSCPAEHNRGLLRDED